MHARDLSGKRGEFIASERLLDFCGRSIPYFDPYLLGEKFPTYDLLVQLTGQHASKPYFLAQVKSTRSGGKKGMADLKVQLNEDVRIRSLRRDRWHKKPPSSSDSSPSASAPWPWST